MAITPLPDAPSRADPDNFATKGDAWVASLATFVTEANALEANVNSKEASATSAASSSSASAAAASTSASNASSSASSASSSAATASAAAVAAEAAFDSFDDRFLGAKSSDPSVDNDGNPLQLGALYFNTSVGEWRGWNGSNWLSPMVIGGTVAALNVTGDLTLSGAVANCIPYLNGSKVITSGSGLAFDGSNIGVGGNLDSMVRLYVTGAETTSSSFAALIARSDGQQVASFRNDHRVALGNNALVVTESGNILINANSDDGSKFRVFGAVDETLANFRQSDNGQELRVLSTADGIVINAANSTERIILSRGALAEHTRFNGGGLGGFKTTNDGTYAGSGFASRAGTLEHVFKNNQDGINIFAISDSAGSGVENFLSALATGATGKHFSAKVNSSSVFYVEADGDVYNTNGTYGTISDPKVKNIIGSKESTWDKTKAYNWIEYYLKSDVNQENKMLGLNAAEALIVSPGVISYTDDTQPVTKTRTVTKTVLVTVTEQQEQTKTETKFIDGAWREITTTQTVDVQVPVYDEFPLVDANGDPVMELVSPAVDAVLDEDGNEIEPAVDAVYAQKVHKVARTEEVTETEEYTENEPTGEQTMAVKYSIVTMLYHRTVQEAQHRIEALEEDNLQLREAFAALVSRVEALESA